MIKGSDDTRYAYINGMIRARESRLLTRGHFDRLIAGSLDNFSTIIADSPYAGYGDMVSGFLAELAGIRGFAGTYCMTPQVTNMLEWPDQVHDLKVKLKHGSDELLYGSAQSEVEAWPEVIDEAGRYAVDKDPFVLSTALDKILCKYLASASEFSPFFRTYYRLYFDLENIRSFFRARQFDDSRELFMQVFIPYGNLGRAVFLDNITAGYEHLGKIFFSTPYMSVVERGCVYLEEKRSFLRLERLTEEMRLGFIKQARTYTFGVEPLFCYYEFKKNEIKKLRQVYYGKLNEVPVDELKESIPDVW